MCLRTSHWVTLCGTCRLMRLVSHLVCPGRHTSKIPTKTPLLVGQLCGRQSSFLRQPDHVALIVFLSIAFFLNLLSSVRVQSIMSLRLMVFVHLFWISCSVAVSRPSLLRIRLSFLIFHIRYTILDTMIWNNLFFPLSGLPLCVKFASPHPRMSPSFIGRGVGYLLFHSVFARFQAFALGFAVQVLSMCFMSSWLLHRGHTPLSW